MKKKFKITESQAKMMLSLTETDDPGGITTSSGPCDQWLTTYPNGLIGGDINCCDMLAAGTLTSAIKQKCNDTWTPVGSGWQECCRGNDDPDPCNNEELATEECWFCRQPGTPCDTLSNAGLTPSWAFANSVTLFTNQSDCALNTECDDDGGEMINCQCCQNGNGIGWGTPVPASPGCSALDGTSTPPLYNCTPNTSTLVDCGDHNHNDGPCPHGTVTMGATPQDPNEGHCMECFAGTAAGPNNAYNSAMASITGWNCECCKKDGRTNTGNGDRPCPDVECKNPNQVMNPVTCECECKDGVGEKGCIKKPYVHWNPDECCCEDKKGICDPSGQHTPGNSNIIAQCCSDPQGNQISNNCNNCVAPNTCGTCTGITEQKLEEAQLLKEYINCDPNATDDDECPAGTTCSQTGIAQHMCICDNGPSSGVYHPPCSGGSYTANDTKKGSHSKFYKSTEAPQKKSKQDPLSEEINRIKQLLK